MRTDEALVKSDCGVRFYKAIYANHTNISVKNFKNAIDFRPDQRERCKNSWYQDVRSSHVRNKRLLDLPRKYPACCADIYNMILDRQKQKKLERYGLSRPVRTMVSHLKVEEVEECKPETEESPGEMVAVDCVQIPESDSEDESEEDDDEEEEDQCVWLAEVERKCSECYTLGDRRKVKKDWRDLLHGSEEEYCKGVVRGIMKKYKGRLDAELKLKTRI